jgi:hypothetical protein
MIKVKDFVNFLKEELTENIHIYFFHPKLTYESRIEEQATELINLYFDNPVVYNIQEHRTSFFDNVDEINNVVILPYPNGMVSPRTYKRIQFAFDRLLNIYYIHPQKFKIFKVEEIEFFTNKLMSDEELKNNTCSPDDYFKETEIV